MAEDNGKIEIDVDLAVQNAESLGELRERIRGLETAVKSLGEKYEESARSARQSSNWWEDGFKDVTDSGQRLTQRIQGVAAAVQGLVSQLGGSNRAAGLVASVAANVGQFAAMGSMLGPAGAVVGGIVGLSTAIAGLILEHRAAAEEANGHAESLRDLAGAATAARGAVSRSRDISSAARTGGETGRLALAGLSEDELSAEAEPRRQEVMEIARIRADVRARRDTGLESSAGGGIAAILRGRSEADIRSEITALENEARTREMVAEAAAEETRAREANAEAAERETEAIEAADEAASDEAAKREERAAAAEAARARRVAAMDERLAEVNAVFDEELAREEEIWAMRLARVHELEEARIEAQNRELDNQARVNEALAEAEQELQDRIAEGRQAMKEAATELAEQQLAEREEMNTEMMGLLNQTTQALGKTIGSIVLGEKSAEEAFKGLAAAFLEMISQYASLKAATEFADAAASFARYDFGGGAAHIGAGLAFTAVAVATGIGAAALNQPPQAPARPEAGQQPTEGGGGGDVILNWNAPTVTAMTRAELGREISTLASEGASL